MRKGDLGDRVFVSLRGNFGIYIKEYEPGRAPDVVVNEFNAVGEKALMEEGDRRSATVTAVDPDKTICLSMDKTAYGKLIRYRKMTQKEQRLDFMLAYPLFRKWPRTRLVVINDTCIE